MGTYFNWYESVHVLNYAILTGTNKRKMNEKTYPEQYFIVYNFNAKNNKLCIRQEPVITKLTSES